jgi:integrase
MRLTSRDVATLALPHGKTDALYFDDAIPGLALRLRAAGGRTWVFQYRVGGRQRRLNLGAAGAANVSEIRKRAAVLYAEVKLGRDPANDKSKSQARASETFAAILPTFLKRQQERLRPRALAEVKRHLTIHAKRLHQMALADIARRDIAGVLTAIAAQLSGASANRVRTSLSSFFSWCVREGLLEGNPAAWTERREEAARQRLLTNDELHEIWAALRNDVYGDIVRLLILTGARREEIGALRRSEFNLDLGVIALPAERTKNRRPHEIVLSSAARSILQVRPRLFWPDSSPCDLVFGRGARGFSDWVGSKADLDNRIAAARKGRGEGPLAGWVLHDFRRLVSTTLHDQLGIAPHIIESILGHVGHQAGVAGRYNLATYREEKARALALWADHVLAVVEGRKSHVVAL